MRLPVFVMAVVLGAGSVCGAQVGVTMSCGADPRSPQEAALMKQGPHGVRRMTRHAVSVGWASGVHVFKDTPPYSQELGSSYYAYCGYNATVKMHLLLHPVGDLFTGQLLDDVTGKVLPGGQGVMFSPDLKFYAATEQPNGQDGDMAALYTREGKLLWKGYDGILAADGSKIVAEFDKLYWDAKGRLVGEDNTAGQPKRVFTLAAQPDGKWKWMSL
jgi:hypothetical protein